VLHADDDADRLVSITVRDDNAVRK